MKVNELITDKEIIIDAKKLNAKGRKIRIIDEDKESIYYLKKTKGGKYLLNF